MTGQDGGKGGVEVVSDSGAGSPEATSRVADDPSQGGAGPELWDAIGAAGVRVHDLLYRDGEDRSDGSEAEREAAAKLEKALLRADVTGDGRLSREEVRACSEGE